ncbi:MAG: DUF3320 domain-containing protein [Candidatus Hydrogenedentes bacterium]|nr:DUF3320 domain-containing protein [Candidatus Hydrogenedentota bacterium]
MAGDLELPRGVSLYSECSELPHDGSSIGLLDASHSVVALTVVHVVRIESPIHEDEVVRRVRSLWGYERAGSNIQEKIKRGIQHACNSNQIRSISGFLFDPVQTLVPVRRRVRADIALICEEELDAAILLVLRNQFATAVDDVMSTTARYLGFRSSGKRVEGRIRERIAHLINSGALYENQNSMLDLVEGSSRRADNSCPENSEDLVVLRQGNRESCATVKRELLNTESSPQEGKAEYAGQGMQVFAAPSEVMRNIERMLRSEYPRDRDMWEEERHEQLKGYGYVASFSPAGVPLEVINAMLRAAQDEYPNDYGMQKDVLQLNLSGYRFVENFNPPGVPREVIKAMLEAGQDEYPNDYDMQKDLLELNVSGYRFVENFNPPGVPREVINAMLRAARDEYPNDYDMQKDLLELNVSGYRFVENFCPAGMSRDAIEAMLRVARSKYPCDWNMQKELLEQSNM